MFRHCKPRALVYQAVLYATLTTIGASSSAIACPLVSNKRPVELRGLPGSTQSQAFAVNNKDVIVGVSGTGTEANAVRWNPDGTPTRLLTPRGSKESDASAINDAGVIAGSIDVHAARWNLDGTITRLTVPPGFIESYVEAINDSGTMVGAALNSDGHARAMM